MNVRSPWIDLYRPPRRLPFWNWNPLRHYAVGDNGDLLNRPYDSRYDTQLRFLSEAAESTPTPDTPLVLQSDILFVQQYEHDETQQI